MQASPGDCSSMSSTIKKEHNLSIIIIIHDIVNIESKSLKYRKERYLIILIKNTKYNITNSSLRSNRSQAVCHF